METEKKLETVEEAPVLMEQDVVAIETSEVKKEIPLNDWHSVKAGEPSTGAKGTKWIRNQAEGTKQCDACGAVMRGWAYREPFKYCPKCGALAEKEE